MANLGRHRLANRCQMLFEERSLTANMMIYGNLVEVLVCGIGPGFENVAGGRDGKELLVVD